MFEIIKEIAGIIWTIWCLFIGIVIIFLNLPFLLIYILIFSSKKNNSLDFFLRFTAKSVIFFWGIKIKFINKSKINNTKNYVFISNHRSYLDVFIAIIGIKQYKKFLGKEEVFNWPIIGFFAKKLGHISVKRESSKDREKSYLSLLEILKKGCSIFLCPEGAVYMNDNLLNEMRNGAFRMAIETNTPIIAITIINAGELFPPHKIRIRPGKCINYISDPFYTNHLSIEDTESLRNKITNEILKNLKLHYPKGKYPLEFNPNDFPKAPYHNTLKK